MPAGRKADGAEHAEESSCLQGLHAGRTCLEVRMKTMHKRCAGLDVHKKEVVVCLRIATRGKVEHTVRRFPTTTKGLLELAGWLEEMQCRHVAMEATGVYWKPVWHILEGRFALVLANATHVKGVPGRKSDVNDATWIADLLAHGLIRASFVPPQPIQELRDLTRTRKQFGREIVQHAQRIQAVLEEANVKLSSVITDILGASGRRMLKAIVGGEADPTKLASLGNSRLAASPTELSDALFGHVSDHHRFLIRHHLTTIEQLEAAITQFDARIEAALRPFRDTVERLKELPGLSETSAQILVAEIGFDMSPFPTAGHLLSWAGLVPRQDESAGKRRSTRIKKGAPWLKPVLVQCAWGAARKKNSYYQAQFLRLKARCGPKKAAIAVAASILQTAYHMLKDGTCYQDLGADHFARRNPQREVEKLARRIRSLGFAVDIRAAA
jgi:transposase